jgi:hypothetical protein
MALVALSGPHHSNTSGEARKFPKPEFGGGIALGRAEKPQVQKTGLSCRFCSLHF